MTPYLSIDDLQGIPVEGGILKQVIHPNRGPFES
jgi:hypothetical protein